MVSESELIDRLREFLRNSDLTTTTTAAVRRQLESDFGIDLSDRKAFIREQVDLFLRSEHPEPQSDDEEEQEQEQEEAPEEEEEEEAPDEEVDKPEQSQASEEAEDDDNEEVEERPKRTRSVKKKRKPRSNNSSDEVVKKKGGGFCKLCSLSPQLQELVGAPEMARTEVVKKLWVYIKANNLQDPTNKRTIICDEPLRAIFAVNSINMFQMNKALSKHIWPLDSDEVVQVKSEPKEKQKKQESEDEDDSDESEKKAKRQKGGKSGFLAPLRLSDALANFLGTGDSELSRSEVTKRMWDYIKGNNLQDPSDKRKVICDEKLKELFEVDTFVGFTVSKLLAPHFIKAEQ